MSLPVFKKIIHQNQTVIKYLFAGGTATLATFFFLWFFTEIFGLWYLLSSVLAFCIAVIISFTLQKLWTFKGEQEKKTHHQFVLFLSFGIFGLGVNAASMFLLVDKAHLWYMLAQFITSAGIAVMNFLFYRLVVFKHKEQYT